MHQQANGKAESAVKVMKTLLEKCEVEKTDPYEAVLEQRNTPIRQDTCVSPAEVMFNRIVCGMIPQLQQKFEKPETLEIARRRNQHKQTVKKSFDRKSCEQNDLDVGQAVYFQHLEGRNWKLGEISGILGPRSYVVKDQNGTSYRRNRIHLRPTNVNFQRSPIRSVIKDYSGSPQKTLVTDPEPMNKSNMIIRASEPETLSMELTELKPMEPLREGRPSLDRRKPAYLKDYVTN